MNNVEIFVPMLYVWGLRPSEAMALGLDSATTDCKFTAPFGSQCSFCRFAS